jgi:hypothetical protein
MRALTWASSTRALELIHNGAFERGDLSGWRDHGNARRRFTLLTLPPDQAPGDLVLSGHHAATSATQDAGAHALIQEVAIPGDATAAVLRWADRWTANGPFRDSPHQRYRVEVRAPDQTVLATLFQTSPEDALLSGWTRRSADVSAFIGQKVVVAFVLGTQESRVVLSLDEAGIEATLPSSVPEFVVRFAEGTPTTLPEVARVRVPRWTPPPLVPGRTYSWQVIEVQEGQERPGPVWTFLTPPIGPATGFGWALGSPVPNVGLPFPVRLESQDAAGRLIGNDTGAPLLAAMLPGQRIPDVVVRVVDTTIRLTSFANVSTQAVALAGWEAFLYDRVAWPEPRLRFSFPSNAVVLPGGSFDLRSGGVPPGALPAFFTGANPQWDGVASTGMVAVLLRDATGAVADFVALGNAEPVAIRNPVPVVPEHWIGPAIRPLVSILTRVVRSGWTDRHTADDWVAFNDGTAVARNFTNRFSPGPRLVPIQPPTAGPLTAGGWSGSLAVPIAGAPVVLLASDGVARVGLSDPLTVRRAPIIHLELPPSLTEGGSALLGRVRLDQPAAVDLVVRLAATPPNLLTVPPSVILPAGAEHVTFAISPLDDGELNGSRPVVLSAKAANFEEGSATIRLDDDESTTLSIEVPGQAVEGGSSVTGRILLGAPADGPMAVTLRVLPGDQVEVPALVTVPAGSREASFEIRPLNNRAIDGDRTLRLEAAVPNWPSATANFTLHDDEDRILRLDLPTRMGPTEPESSRVGRVRISGTLREPVEIRLVVDPSGWVAIPESVVILPGALEVAIPLSQVQAEAFRGATLATVSAASSGFVTTSSRMEVRDDRVRTLGLAVADLVVHPTSGLLYATVAARDPNLPNSVAELDPVVGNVLRHVAVGPDPVPLALTRDGRFLYVGMHGDGTVRRIRLDTMEAEQPFSLEGYLALALVTLPDQPGAVAVNRHAVNTGQDISVYLDGVRQPGDFPIGTLAASDFTAGPGDHAFIFLPEKQRLKLATTGITSLASAPGESSPVAWRYADGRLYANDGRVFAADDFQPLPSISDIAQGYVYPDPDRQRVYYLGNGEFRNGTQPGLGLVEADMTLGIAGEPMVFPRAQTHSRLVRWGQAGLAFGADDSLHLIETASVPTGPPVNVILSGAPTLHGLSGDVAAWNLTVSNAGPTAATSLRVLGSHDPHLSLVTIEATQGTGVSRYLGFEWLPGHLAPGESAHATVLFRPTGAGEFSLGAVVRSLQVDSQSTDNRLVAVLHSQLRLGPDSIGYLPVPARGLAFDPVSQRLVISVADAAGTQGGDRLLVVNPATSEIESSHPTGPRPGRLALAANGQAIWVAIDGKALLHRFDMSNRTFGVELPRFPTPTDPAPVPREIWDIAPLPGQPERVVATFNAGEAGIDALLLDEAGPVGPGLPMALAVEANPEGTRLYLQEAATQTFQTLEARPEGLRIVDTRPGLFSGLALALLNDRLYTADGRILDAASLTELGRLSLAGSIATQVLPLPSLDRLVFYTPGFGLQVFQLSSRRLLGTIDLPLYVTEMDALIHAGADLLVLTSRDDGGKVTFVRTGLLPTEPPADLGIQVNPNEEFVPSGSFAGLRIEVTNAGPHPARRVRVAMPSIGYGGSVESSMGVFAYNDHTGLDGLVETLDPNQSVVLIFRILSGPPGRVAAPVRTWSASEDSVSSNNFAVTSLGVFAPPQSDMNLPFVFPAAGLVVHPDGTKLFATIPPDHPLAAAGLGIFEILPGSGKISRARPAGNQPGILGITADGSRLWVVTDQGRLLRRLRIDDWVLEREVPLPDSGPITRVVTAPSGHDRLAILRYSGVDIISGDTVRPLPIEITPVGAAIFSDDGERLLVARSRSDFPYDTGWLQAFSLRNADFGAVLGESPRDSHTTSLRAAAGRLYLDGGAVTDPITLEPLPSLAVPGAPMPFPELDRIVYVQRDGGASPTFLRVIDPAGLRDIETQQLCCFYNLDGPELVGRWGIDGIVMRTPQTFYLYRSSLLPAREGLDFDGDSLPDSWERTHGFNPHDPADAVLDPDADGASNLEEWLAGTSPLDAASALRLRIVAGPVPGLRLLGAVGRRYLPEVAPSVQGPWSTAGDAREGAGEELVFPVEDLYTPSTRFFRIRVVQP